MRNLWQPFHGGTGGASAYCAFLCGMKTPFAVRPGTPADCPVVLGLIQELARYERAPQEVELTAVQLCTDLFGPRPVAGLLVAEAGGAVHGAAIYHEKYSTWKGLSLHLEDLIVAEAWRGRGLGKALFEAVMELAYQGGYARMDWQVLDWNEPAITFYKSYQAQISSEWLNGRFTREQLAQWHQRTQA